MNSLNTLNKLTLMLRTMKYLSKKRGYNVIPPKSITGLTQQEFVYFKWKYSSELKSVNDPEIKKAYINLLSDINSNNEAFSDK